ncbi:MAG: NERD domain-containing protein [Betaproteobacteria bacterium]|nr:NERD domain-containing protein [Betaproteobacteria bacterium]MCL2886668.1 NERD domain-containing protein [Betaproteobacteria bacterium]
MLIKQADDKTRDVQALTELASRTDITAEIRQRIEQEIRNIRAGQKGEVEAAYEIDFHYASSKNWMIIHDLRLECEGRVAQIDHLLINRFMEIYVCESKRFGEGIAINEHGEFTAFYANKKAYGVPSPIEQNKRHMAVLEVVFKSGQVPPPKRLGFTINPVLSGLVLVSKNARITRPTAKLDGLEQVIKNDQLKARIANNIEKESNVLNAARVIGQDTLEDFARRLAAAHQPVSFEWAAKFGLPKIAPIATSKPASPLAPTPEEAPPPAVASPALPEASATAGAKGKSSKLICHQCNASVSYTVAKFCWGNKARFNGNVYCMDCQKSVTASA